jgi:hypothetical protein
MITRVIVVQPIGGWYQSDETDTRLEPVQGTAAAPKGAAPCAANGQVIAALSALVQKLVVALPTLLPEIQAIIALFGQPASPAAPTT